MITIQVYFCHTTRQAEEVMKKIRTSERFDRFVIFHSCKFDFYGKLFESEQIVSDGLSVPINPIKTNNKDGSVVVEIYQELSRCGMDYEGVHIEVDLTNARPEESFAICWNSAALDINAYVMDKRNEKTKKIFMDPVPSFITLSDIDMSILDAFQYKEMGFTNLQAREQLLKMHIDVSDNTINRSTSGLLKLGLLSKADKRLSNAMAGRDYRLLYVTDEGRYMLGMNNRSKGISNHTSEEKLKQSYDKYVSDSQE